jgi:CRISPR-associated protein Csm5
MSQFQGFTLSLTTLAPLHIGSQEGDLGPMEFAVFQGRCYVIAEERLAAVLQERGLLEDFSQAAIQGGRRFNLQAYLRGQGLLREDVLGRVSRYSSQCAVQPRPTLRPFVRDGLACPFIPGSAVKGPLRVAILFCLLQTVAPERRQALLDEMVREHLARFRADRRSGYGWFRERYKQNFDQQLDQNLFQHFRLLPGPARWDPHTDLFRALKVADSPPLDRDGLRVEEVKVYSLRAAEKPWSIFVECLPPGRTVELTITVDLGLLRDFARHNPRLAWDLPFEEVHQLFLTPLQAPAAMAREVLAYERRLFVRDSTMQRAFSFPREPNLRLGWGGGLLSTTVDLLLPEDLRRQLRDTLFTPRPGAPAPKSRKVIRGGTSLGWVAAAVTPVTGDIPTDHPGAPAAIPV